MKRTSKEWRHPSTPKPKTFRTQFLQEGYADCFWDERGVILEHNMHATANNEIQEKLIFEHPHTKIKNSALPQQKTVKVISQAIPSCSAQWKYKHNIIVTWFTSVNTLKHPSNSTLDACLLAVMKCHYIYTPRVNKVSFGRTAKSMLSFCKAF